ncbi:nitroreductase [Rhodospirillaceae bacterium KN72]|uniref:Nitroreductase n=1 Tax=Pacificispira spongiicola TaxID=2729598 RepID=A0A7Y0DWL5_9PROT|nr:nitroreductase [Pacificispira spongiicola]NMM42928.1 nitroreductase [Pacificispira spongiicola]
MKVSDALDSRISCRKFLSTPVPKETVEAILKGAARAPSNGNLQPWHVFALTGDPLKAVLDDIASQMAETPRGEKPEVPFYPDPLDEPYQSRRFKCGEDMYATIGIARDNKIGRIRQFQRNFRLFDAPVGLYLYIDETMNPRQWGDVGMFAQSVMLLAREHGLHTCAQGAWGQFHSILRRHLSPKDGWILFCGIALGYMDEDDPINSLRTDRATLDDFAQFSGF